jgi:hypothetical protein
METTYFASWAAEYIHLLRYCSIHRCRASDPAFQCRLRQGRFGNFLQPLSTLRVRLLGLQLDAVYSVTVFPNGVDSSHLRIGGRARGNVERVLVIKPKLLVLDLQVL